MKASEIIRQALAEHYMIKPDDGKQFFMCFAIVQLFANRLRVGFGPASKLKEVTETIETFIPILHQEDTEVLTNYLKHTNKRYASYRERFGDQSRACINIRIKFWNDHIARLEEQGL